MDPSRIFNGYDLAKYLQCPMISVSSHWFKLTWYEDGQAKVHVYGKRTGPALHKDKSNEAITHGSWPKSVAAAKKRFKIDPESWVPILGANAVGDWIPASEAQRATEQKLRWSRGSRALIKFGEPGLRPCTQLTNGYSSGACGRPAIASEETGRNGLGDEDGIAWRCKMHESHHQRAVANDEKRAAETEERRERYRRAQQNDKAAEDWARRLKEEFGLDTEATDNGKVEVLANPEKLYGRLLEITVELREMGIDIKELIG